MIVTLEDLPHVTYALMQMPKIGLDTETTGLRPHHGDRIFSLILVGDLGPERHRYYFNFWAGYEGVPRTQVLDKEVVLPYLQEHVFDRTDVIYYAHNFKFDLHMLAQDGVTIAGTTHCTQAMGRVVYNQFTQYDLATSLERIGLEKDGAVEEYIEAHELFELVEVPGRKQRDKRKFYYKVPFDIIVPYGIKDAEGTYVLGQEQEREIADLDTKIPPHIRPLRGVMENERRLTKTLLRMERNGCRIDRPYCKQAVVKFTKEADDAERELSETVGASFKNSAKWFELAFAGHEHEFTPAEKKGWSFDKDALKKITHPLVETVLRYRAAKNRLGFFQGFLYHADDAGYVHPSFNPDRTKHGRLSSSNPNFQNLKKDEVSEDEVEDGETETYVRRAVIPSPGNILLMPDYRGMEYAMALEIACQYVGYLVPLAKMVNDGLRFHDATIQLVRDTGFEIADKQAKIGNFLSLFEGGIDALAGQLVCDRETARGIQAALNATCPELHSKDYKNPGLRQFVIGVAKRRGWLVNWFGRRCYFPDSRYAYRGPNHIISGGCADVMKIALNNMQDHFDAVGSKAKMIMTVHDNVVLDCPKEEAVERAHDMVRIMVDAYPAEYVPMQVTMEWSERSLAHAVKGMPDETQIFRSKRRTPQAAHGAREANA